MAASKFSQLRLWPFSFSFASDTKYPKYAFAFNHSTPIIPQIRAWGEDLKG